MNEELYQVAVWVYGLTNIANFCMSVWFLQTALKHLHWGYRLAATLFPIGFAYNAYVFVFGSIMVGIGSLLLSLAVSVAMLFVIFIRPDIAFIVRKHLREHPKNAIPEEYIHLQHGKPSQQQINS